MRNYITTAIQKTEFWAAATLLAFFVSLYLFCAKNMDVPLCKGSVQEAKASYCPGDVGFARFCAAADPLDPK